jgi:hypothetical protein
VRHKAKMEDVVSRWSLAGEALLLQVGELRPTGRREACCVVAPGSDSVSCQRSSGYRPTWRILMSSGSHSYRGQMCVCNFGTKLPWISKLIRRSRSGWSAPQSRLTIAACALRRRLSSPRKATPLRAMGLTGIVDTAYSLLSAIAEAEAWLQGPLGNVKPARTTHP